MLKVQSDKRDQKDAEIVNERTQQSLFIQSGSIKEYHFLPDIWKISKNVVVLKDVHATTFDTIEGAFPNVSSAHLKYTNVSQKQY